MKATIYIFGNFANGYSQYPDDYSRDLIGTVSKFRKGATELVYHREGALTYYLYSRELSHSSNTFVGLCYVFNGVLITDFSFLFDVFEDAITNIVVKGELLEFADDGGLLTRIDQLFTHTEELQRVSDYLNSKLTSLGKFAQKLPPVNYSVSNAEWKVFSFDEMSDISNAIKNYSNIRVIKGDNYDTESLKGYASKIKTQNNKIQKLEEENGKLIRQKKQIKWILILLLIIMIGCICFYFYAQHKEQVIHAKTGEISDLHDEINRKNRHIQTLKNDSVDLSNQYNAARQNLINIHDELTNTVSLYTYFDSWTSTNSRQPNSTSRIIYSFYAYEDDVLNIPYFVSSESGCDYLSISLKRSGYGEYRVLRESGVMSSTFNYTFPASDSYQLIISYKKDGSVDKYNDNAGVYRFNIYRTIVSKLIDMSETNNDYPL